MGPYSNETSLYIPSADWLDGQWLMHEDGRLYIITVNGDGIEGPDDELCDQILQTVGGAHRLTDNQCSTLGLTEVANILKRFDPSIGYYSA